MNETKVFHDSKIVMEMAEKSRQRALEVLERSGIAGIWEQAGCRVNVVGSLRMGLLASHRDIDLHVYSSGITVERSFAVMAEVAKIPEVMEIRCINGLDTDEHCIAWHVFYKVSDGEIWQFDIIHIESGTEYDSYFERMADRIVEVMTPAQRETILLLKFGTPPEKDFHGVEYYEAVIADGVETMEELEEWVAIHRRREPYYWIP